MLLWACSGMLHPLLVRGQPQLHEQEIPALIFDPGVEQLLTPAQLAAMTGIREAVRLRLITLADTGLYYQIQTAGETVPRYFNAVDGSELVDGDRKFAIALARHYLGDHDSEIRDMDRVTQFGGQYARLCGNNFIIAGNAGG